MCLEYLILQVTFGKNVELILLQYTVNIKIKLTIEIM